MSYHIILTDYTPTARTDGEPWTHALIQEASTAVGTWTTLEDVTLDPVDTNPAAPATRTFEADGTLEHGWYRVVWVDDDGAQQSTAAVLNDTTTLWVTVPELAGWLRSSLDDDDAQALLAIRMAVSAIAAAADKTDDWASALDPVPGRLRDLALIIAARAMSNPTGARSESKQLGAAQRTVSFRDTGGGLELTSTEEQLVRRIVHGRTSASSRPDSLLTDLGYSTDVIDPVCELDPDAC